MSEVKFTKGKWSAHDKRPQCNGFSIFAENQYVAFVGDSDDNTDCKANANLIAAAPEMYEMLVQLQIEGGLGIARHRQIDRLLSKARGESC
jgi:hypothetical protein